MPEQIKAKMNGVIPSVPITTLAGIASLTDLLPEMPLPTPLPQTLSNKSLLFHPRVAEEAEILLSVRDENLVPQLILSLSQTSSDHIELKDQYATTEQSLEAQQNTPELLKAILQINPHVFKGPQYNSPRWTAQGHQQPANYGRFSPTYSNSSGSRQTPQGSPAHPAAVRSVLPPPAGVSHAQHPRMPVAPQNHADVSQTSPFAVPSPSPRATVITEQTRTSTTPQHITDDSCLNSLSNMTQLNMQSPAHIGSPNTPMSAMGNLTPQHSVSSIMTPQHNMQITPPSDTTLPVTHQYLHKSPHLHESQVYRQDLPLQDLHVAQPQEHHPMHQPHEHLQQVPVQNQQQTFHQYQPQPMEMQHQIFDSMVNEQLQQSLQGQSMELEHSMQQNQQFVLNPTPGLPDIAGVPIDRLQAGQTASIPERDSMPIPVQQQSNMFPDVNTNLNASLSATFSSQPQSAPPPQPAPVQQQSIMEPYQQLQQLHLERQQLQMEQNQQFEQMMQQHLQQKQNCVAEADSKVGAAAMKEPIVMLNRLSLADQALMKKSLTAFAEKSPTRAAKMGITNAAEVKSDSESEEEVGKNNKYFKSRAKERQVQKEKERAERKTDDKLRKRKRIIEEDDESEDKKDDALLAVKPKIRKFEKKLIPVMPKLSVEELMETNTYQRFNSTIETVFENTEEASTFVDLDEDGDVPSEMLIAKYQLHDLCTEAAKLKALGAMESIPPDRLVRLLNILEKNIRDGARVSPLADPDDDEGESRLWTQLAMERVQRAVDASLVSLHIMTSHNMPKTIYLEDVIDRIILFMKFQLQNTIYPSFDPVYKIDSKSKTDHFNAGRKKRGHMKEVREKSILQVYNKMHELVSLLAELLNIQVLTDTTVLHASTLGVAPFFVESVSDLQLSALKLVTVIFTKYEKHRRLLLDDILASIARLPSSKRSLRTYRLNSEDYIQMLTALVLQLIQCVVTLPDNSVLGQEKGVKEIKEEEEKKEASKSSHIDVDVLIITKYETATRLAANFLTVFLSKCGSKGEEIDYRPLFENFIQDLLMTVNKPEWPAAELLLSLLGNLLVGHFSNKSSDMALRVASIEYLGVVTARLRKDAVTSRYKLATIDQIITDIKLEQARDSEYDQVKDKEIPGLSQDEERTVFLQKVLLDYLAVNATKDSALGYARHFYLAQWYRECYLEKSRVGKPQHSPSKKIHKKRGRKKNRHRDSDSEVEIEEPDPDENYNNEQKYSEMYRIIGEKKKLIISKIKPYSSGTKHDILQTYIDYNSAELISQYVASKRAFSQSFDRFLKQILHVLTEPSIAIRTKAMKCLTMIVEADPSVLALTDMQLGVKHSFLDSSTSVREAAVDLVGKFILNRPELIDKYNDMLLNRIRDKGVSVRKRVIKILKDVCMECPDYPKIPEACVAIIRRVTDEEGIRKLVMEVFQNMWFTPVRERPTLDSQALLRKVMNITDVVAIESKDMGLEWFEQLLVSLFKPKEDKEDSTKLQTEPPKTLLTACKQIVDCLIENVLRLEETNFKPAEDGKQGASQRLVACLTTIYLFSKIRPQLLVNHAITLQPYLTLKCQTKGDCQIISNVAHTLELVVPLMEHPSETFLATVEEDCVKLILLHDKSVVASCLSCLGSIVNNVTKNFKLIRDCFNKYYGHLSTSKTLYETNPKHPVLLMYRPFFRRALFTVGLLLRHFDFTDPNVIKGLPENIKDQVFETLNYFVHQDNDDMRQFTLSAIGSLCIRHYEFMLIPELKELYHHLLTSELAPVQMRISVLNNIELYLQEEEKRMIKQDLEWAKLSKQENLKEMGDVSSGMASTVIQIYLKQILESFLHNNVNVRHASLKVIQLILAQGLVHPVQIVPYLICMSTDCEKMVSHSADKQLQDIEKKYPGFIHMKSQFGIKLSYRLQEILQNDTTVRGMQTPEGEYPSALNGFLYTILRNTKQQRRAIVLSFLKQFDEAAKTSLSQMLYLADNLAYFSYQVQDEPLFIIHHIDIIISVSGTNLLQSFKEALLPKQGIVQQAPVPMETETPQVPNLLDPNVIPKPEVLLAAFEDEEDDEEDEDAVLAQVPESTTLLREYITASQGFLLLLTLRQHLKDLYGFSDAKISQYSPSEAAKVYEKAVNRKSNLLFNPKATLQRLQEGTSNEEELDEEGRRRLVKEYLDFKQLVLKFDPDDPDDEDNDLPPKRDPDQPPIILRLPNTAMQTESADGSTPGPTQQSPVQYRVNQVNSVEHPTNQSSTPRVPKLTIHAHPEHRKHRTHKTEKPKKHKKKKRRRLSDSSDSDDCSDPDFLV